jgi:NDP-mannose synthase
MPLGDYPILEVILRQLASFRFERVTLAVNHQADLIRAFCGDGSKWGLRIDYSLEDKPLSTIGPLKLIPDLPEDFILMNGDVLTDLDFGKLYDDHVAGQRLFTIAASEREHLVDYGVLRVNDENRLTGFEEKPVLHYLVSMGVYVMNRRLLETVPPDVKYGFDNLMVDSLAAQRAVQVVKYPGYWLDIGRVDDYMRAIEEFETKRGDLIRDGH